MAKVCTNEKTASRQRWIENGLLELMQERKFEKITVTELCLHLNLSRRSFYRYFRDLEDVLEVRMALEELAVKHACRRITQEQLAERASVSRSLISSIEAAGIAKSFSLEVFYNISDALEIEPATLLSAPTQFDNLLKQNT